MTTKMQGSESDNSQQSSETEDSQQADNEASDKYNKIAVWKEQ